MRMMIVMVKVAMMMAVGVMAEGLDCWGGCYSDDECRCVDRSRHDWRGNGCRGDGCKVMAINRSDGCMGDGSGSDVSDDLGDEK